MKQRKSSCDSCMYYEYDEDYECYVCGVNLDEDEMARFMEDRFYDCPYSGWGMNTPLSGIRCSKERGLTDRGKRNL